MTKSSRLTPREGLLTVERWRSSANEVPALQSEFLFEESPDQPAQCAAAPLSRITNCLQFVAGGGAS